MPHAALLLASLVIAPLQAPAAQPSEPVSWRYPIGVHVMTVIDHADVLGGQRVRVPGVRVQRVIGPRLILVGESRARGIEGSYGPDFRVGKLLVLLPSAVALSRGQVLALTGIVRTVAGARADGLPVDEGVKDPKHRKRIGAAPLLVADAVETSDGVALAGKR
jgi:hypothetical protein